MCAKSESVVLYDHPQKKGTVVGVLKPGMAIVFDAECAGWMRAARPLDDGAPCGWAPLDSLVAV